MDPFVLDDLRLDPSALPKEGPRFLRASRRRRTKGLFLAGGIPWSWIVAAGRLRGHAWHVGTFVWLRVGLEKRDTVAINLSKIASEFGLDRATASRALAALEDAGLVEVERRAGSKARVTVLRERASGAVTGGSVGGDCGAEISETRTSAV